MVKMEGFDVSLGNGEIVEGIRECKAVVLQLPTITIVKDFLPLTLGNSDLILGVQWIEKLGTVTTTWKNQTLKFTVGRQHVTIQGDPGFCRSKISLKAMIRTIKKGGSGYLIECNAVATTNAVNEVKHKEDAVPQFLQTTLQRYEAVFHMPKGLPPLRGLEHGIILKEGTNPVSVRPYRYSQAQKNEIESLIRDMLKAGIIQPSHSPFSSSVILVKKKDGSW